MGMDAYDNGLIWIAPSSCHDGSPTDSCLSWKVVLNYIESRVYSHALSYVMLPIDFSMFFLNNTLHW